MYRNRYAVWALHVALRYVMQQEKAKTPGGFDAWPFFVFAHARGPLHV